MLLSSFLETGVVFVFGPVVACAVLDPFEVGAYDAADVAHDVREDFDAVFFEVFVCCFIGRAVCAFEDEFCFYFSMVDAFSWFSIAAAKMTSTSWAKSSLSGMKDAPSSV